MPIIFLKSHTHFKISPNTFLKKEKQKSYDSGTLSVGKKLLNDSGNEEGAGALRKCFPSLSFSSSMNKRSTVSGVEGITSFR